MELLKNITFKNRIHLQVIAVAIIVLSVCFIGYMVGQFTWYLTH